MKRQDFEVEVDNFLRPIMSKHTKAPWNFGKALVAATVAVWLTWAFFWVWFFVTGKP